MAVPGTFHGAHTVKLVDDNTADLGTASNPIYTSVTGAGSGGTSSVDKATFTGGTSAGTALMGVVTPTDVPVAANKIAVASLATDRSVNVTIVGGSISGGNAAASATGSSVPASAGYLGISVGGTLRGATGFDLDSGAGTEFAQGLSLRKIASGGSVEAGTATDPLRTDPTGSTTQPVSGTVTANIGSIGTLATAALQTTGNTSLSSIDGKITAVNTGAVVLSSGTVTTVSTVTNLSQLGGAAVAMNTGTRSAGTLRVTVATDDVVPASQSGTWTVQPGNTPNSTPWLITDTPATSGGLSKFHLVGAASDNATNVKASAGQVYSITAFNIAATPRYLKFHNTAGTPTAGTAITDTFLIPGNASGAGLVLNVDKGIAFGTGIGISIVTGIADNSTTAIGASEVVINIYYK